MEKSRFKQIRLNAELTQAQLAELFGVSSQNLVSKWEKGKKNPSRQTVLLYQLLREGKLKPKLK